MEHLLRHYPFSNKYGDLHVMQSVEFEHYTQLLMQSTHYNVVVLRY